MPSEAVPALTSHDYPVMMSGWLKLVQGFAPGKALNIHPGPTWKKGVLRPYAGRDKHGMAVHEAVCHDFKAGLLSHTEVTLHLVTDEYDAGAVVARFPVPLYCNDTPASIARRVNKMEHLWQWRVMSDWLHGKIRVSETGLVTSTPYPT